MSHTDDGSVVKISRLSSYSLCFFYVLFNFRCQMDSPVLPSMDPNWAVNTPYKSRQQSTGLSLSQQQSSGLSLTQPQAPSSILRPYGTSSSKNSARNALDGIYADIAYKVETSQHLFSVLERQDIDYILSPHIAFCRACICWILLSSNSINSTFSFCLSLSFSI